MSTTPASVPQGPQHLCLLPPGPQGTIVLQRFGVAFSNAALGCQGSRHPMDLPGSDAQSSRPCTRTELQGGEPRKRVAQEGAA